MEYVYLKIGWEDDMIDTLLDIILWLATWFIIGGLIVLLVIG